MGGTPSLLFPVSWLCSCPSVWTRGAVAPWDVREEPGDFLGDPGQEALLLGGLASLGGQPGLCVGGGGAQTPPNSLCVCAVGTGSGHAWGGGDSHQDHHPFPCWGLAQTRGFRLPTGPVERPPLVMAQQQPRLPHHWPRANPAANALQAVTAVRTARSLQRGTQSGGNLHT